MKSLADLGQDRHAELAAAVGDHEIDCLGRGQIGGADEIPFILAVFGVDDDHDLAAADGIDGFFDRGKGYSHGKFLAAVGESVAPSRAIRLLGRFLL